MANVIKKPKRAGTPSIASWRSNMTGRCQAIMSVTSVAADAIKAEIEMGIIDPETGEDLYRQFGEISKAVFRALASAQNVESAKAEATIAAA